MTLMDRIREKDFVRTNDEGAKTLFPIGAVVEHNGTTYRVTRHRFVPTSPWATIIVYGRPV